MHEEKVTYWQVGSGNRDRFYHEEMLNYGIACAGEGYYEKSIKRVKENDVVILRQGTTKIISVGKVVEKHGKVHGCGDKTWLYHFDGWELPAYCYVEWHKMRTSKKKERRLPWLAFSKIDQNEPRGYAEQILGDSPETYLQSEEPPEAEEVSHEQMRTFLEENARSADADEAIKVLQRLKELTDHYYQAVYGCKDEIKEHEVRTFLIVPLLLALGWKEREIKIELSPGRLGLSENHSIDIALFPRGYEPGKRDVNKRNCGLLIESKRFSAGMTKEAPDQVAKYARNITGCRTVVVSNGYCYKAFRREEKTDAFDKESRAYFNLRRPTSRYPLYPGSVGGTLDLLELLLPDSYR